MSKSHGSCPFFNGMNLRQAEQLACRTLGAMIYPGRRNGHHVAAHHLASRRCEYNCRRKDATRDFIGWCRIVWWLMNDGDEHRQPAA